MINNISLSKFRHLELKSFISDELVEAAKIDSNDLKKIVSELTDYTQKYSEGIFLRRANPLTAKIKDNSAMLSRIFSAMRAVVKVELLNPFAEHVDEAKAVNPMLKSYASVFSRGSLRQKIEQSGKFVTEAKSEKLQQKIKNLKLDELLGSFDKLHSSLAQDFAERGDEIRPNNKVDVQALRKLILHRYGMLLHYVEFLHHFSPSQEVEDFIARHNNRVSEMKSVINLRSTSSAKREKAKRLRLREMALKIGWQLPVGEKDFKYQGSLRIWHPTENHWYRLGHREGKLTLVKVDRTSSDCRHRPSNEKTIDLSGMKKSEKGSLNPSESAVISKETDKMGSTPSKKTSESSASDSSSAGVSMNGGGKNTSKPTDAVTPGKGGSSSSDGGGF